MALTPAPLIINMSCRDNLPVTRRCCGTSSGSRVGGSIVRLVGTEVLTSEGLSTEGLITEVLIRRRYPLRYGIVR
jgi:hypothetical protein